MPDLPTATTRRLPAKRQCPKERRSGLCSVPVERRAATIGSATYLEDGEESRRREKRTRKSVPPPFWVALGQERAETVY